MSSGEESDDRIAILVFANHIGIDISSEEHLIYISSDALKDLPPEIWELGIGRKDEVS